MPRLANGTDWLEQLVDRVDAEDGWRVEMTGKGPTAYAPDGASIVQLKDLDTDPRWRQNTLSELRRAGLDLYGEFKSAGTASKKERRARAKRASTTPRRKPTPAPAPMPVPDELPAAVEQWRLSVHARERAEERDIALAEVYATVTLPTQTRAADNESGRMIYQRGDLACIVNEETRTVITVLPPGRINEDEVAAELAEEKAEQEAREQRRAARAAKKAEVVDLREPAATPASEPRAPIFEPPNEAAAFARSLSDEFLLCRELGHNWRPWQAYWDQEKRHYERALKCSRCTTQRWQTLSATGAPLSSSYHHPEGYLHAGRGRIVGTARDSLRLEGLLRQVEGTLRGSDKTKA